MYANAAAMCNVLSLPCQWLDGGSKCFSRRQVDEEKEFCTSLWTLRLAEPIRGAQSVYTIKLKDTHGFQLIVQQGFKRSGKSCIQYTGMH